MLANNPCLSNIEIEEILKMSSEKIDYLNPSYTGRIGAGRLDAAAAVTMSKAISSAISNVTCYGDQNGSISLTINSQNVNQIKWTNGITTEDLNNLFADTYKVQVTYNNGCNLWESFTITQPDSFQVYAQISNATANDGMIHLQVTGGLPGYNYNWSNNETDGVIENLAAGNYMVTITDEGGCLKNYEFEILQLETTASLFENTENNMTVYPNPSNGSSTISWETSDFQQIQIVNQNGQFVLNENIQYLNHFQIDQFASGVYFINLIDMKEQKLTRKLIVQ